MILLRAESFERPIPFPVEKADSVSVEYVHHVAVVAGCGRHRRRWADFCAAEELHFVWRSNLDSAVDRLDGFFSRNLRDR